MIAVLAFGLAGSLLAPTYSAFADPFSITMSRTIYSPDDKVVVLGTVPENGAGGLPVLISIISENGTVCNTSTVLPSADGNFISRAIEMAECGLGHYEAKASYGDLSATASFTVSAKDRVDPSAVLEIRIIKDILRESGTLAYSKVQNLIRSGQDLPADIADTYEQGLAQSSAAMNAAEFGDRDSARSHMIIATDDFRSVIVALNAKESNSASGGLVPQFNVTSEAYLDAKDNLSRLDHFARWLDLLAVKNGYDGGRWFSDASSLLGQANNLLATGDIQNAKQKLSQVSSILEGTRTYLMDKAREAAANATLSSSSTDGITKEKLISLADLIEGRANSLVNASAPQLAHDQLEQALSLVAQVRADLTNGDLHGAKTKLATAFGDLNNAMKIIDKSQVGGDNNDGSASNPSASDKTDQNSNQTQSSSSSAGNNDNDHNSNKHR